MFILHIDLLGGYAEFCGYDSHHYDFQEPLIMNHKPLGSDIRRLLPYCPFETGSIVRIYETVMEMMISRGHQNEDSKAKCTEILIQCVCKSMCVYGELCVRILHF